MDLSVFEGGDVTLIDSCKVDEERVHTACPSVGLFGSVFDVDVKRGVLSERRSYREACVPFA